MDNIEEKYVDIKGYEDLYQISNLGNVKSKDRTVICSNGDLKPIKSRILSPADNGKGYLFVYLWKFNNSKRVYIHRLVAQAFISNPDNLEEINHIDGNTKNNNVNNLEWCNRLYNERAKQSHKSGYPPIKINVLNDNKECIYTFESINECSRQLNITTTQIYVSLRKNRFVYHNNIKYKFEYADDSYKIKHNVKRKLNNYNFSIKINK